MAEPRAEPETRAWTVDEMRKGSGSWSLASDAGMLQHLQEYSQKMISRTHDIQTQVTSLLNEAKLTSVRVNNTFNDFIMLANTQFVENRVYDEDVTQDPASTEESTNNKKEKTKEEREAELVPKVATAMRLGLGVIDSAFEKLDMNEANSDSEDEEPGYKGEPLLEAKDPYLSRPLPYMIGSASFLQDDDVGLIDFPSDDEEEVPPEEDSETESESEGESPAPSPQMRRKQPESDEYSEDSNLFDEEDSEDDLDTEIRPSVRSQDSEDEGQTADTPRDFASELAAKITSAPVAPPESSKEKQGSPKKKKEKSKKRESKPPDDDDLFAPPSRSVDLTEEDEDSPFGRGGGLFSSHTGGGGGLFDDQDDLFSEVTAPVKQKPPPKQKEETSSSDDEVEAPPVKAPSKQKPVGGVSMFGGGEDPDDLFSMPSAATEAPPIKVNTKQAPPTTRQSGGGLFDNSEEEDEEGDFFAAVSKSAKVKDTLPSKPAGKSLSKGLFDDEEDLFADGSPPKPALAQAPSQEVKTKPDKKLPPGAVSMFGDNKNPLLDALKAKQGPQHTDSEDDQMAWSDEDKQSSQSAASKSSASLKSSNEVPGNKPTNQMAGHKPRSGSASSNSLFADDDLFDSSVSKPNKKPTSVPTLTSNKNTTSNGPSSMFDEEEDDLFKVTTTQKAPVEKSLKKSGLFEDAEEEADIFTTEPPPITQQQSKKKPVGGVSLFGGADLFGDSLPKAHQQTDDIKPSQTKTQSQPEKKAEPVPQMIDKGAEPKKSGGFSLFDEGNDEEEEDDIFAQVTSTKTSTKPQVEVTSKPPVEKPPVSKPPLKADVLTKPPSEVPQRGGKVGLSGKPAVKSDLFHEDSDEDLFGDSSPPTKPLKPKPVEKPVAKPPSEPPTQQKVGGVTTTSSTTDVQADSEEEDLFGDSRQTTTKVSEPAKPKKPAGAVSMFGNMDPGAMFGKKTAPKPQDPGHSESTTRSSDPLGSVSTRPAAASPSVQRRVPIATTTTSPAPKVRGSGIQDLQSRLSIKPSSLLPGATPPVEEVSDSGIGFDQPPQSNTLHSVVKDRAKLRTGRKPPSRHARKTRADQSGPAYSNISNIPSQNGISSDKEDITDSRLSFPVPDTGLNSNHKDEPSQNDIDVFMGGNQKAANSITSKDLVQDSDSKKAGLFGNGVDEEGDIFAVSTNKHATKKPKPEYTPSDDVINGVAQESSQADDVINIVAQENTETDDVNTTEKVQSWLEHSEPITKPSSKSVFEDGDEDIFNASKPPSHADSAKKSASQTSQSVRSERSATGSSHQSTVSSKSSNRGKGGASLKQENIQKGSPDGDPLKADTKINDGLPKKTTTSKAVIDDDDIFADTKKSSVKVKPGIDDHDDLFASSKLSSKPKATLTFNDDDDLFSSSKLSASTKPSTKIDDDLFATNVSVPKKKIQVDDDDIFADIMKPSEPVKKVVEDRDDNDIFNDTKPSTASNAAKPKAVASQEVDDIFADISSQPVTQKQEPTPDTGSTAKSTKKSKKSKKSVVKDEDIFKDDTDIFADIPAAKPKQPKAKKTKVQAKPLFGGETDDIFADTSSSTKPRKTTKKSQKSATAAAAAFDKDAPNIFDDPLSALDS